MKLPLFLLSQFFLFLFIQAQETNPGKSRFTAGLSAPEILHAGYTYRLANASQLGFHLGIGPTMGGSWPTISLEHRVYLGKNNSRTNQKTWFFRQGTTYLTSARAPQQFTLNLTGGKDLPSKKKPQNGITIDAGVFYLPDSEESAIILIRSLNLWPALRFQFYFGL